MISREVGDEPHVEEVVRFKFITTDREFVELGCTFRHYCAPFDRRAARDRP
jgi:hypothetical protein